MATSPEREEYGTKAAQFEARIIGFYFIFLSPLFYPSRKGQKRIGVVVLARQLPPPMVGSEVMGTLTAE